MFHQLRPVANYAINRKNTPSKSDQCFQKTPEDPRRPQKTKDHVLTRKASIGSSFFLG